MRKLPWGLKEWFQSFEDQPHYLTICSCYPPLRFSWKIGRGSDHPNYGEASKTITLPEVIMQWFFHQIIKVLYTVRMFFLWSRNTNLPFSMSSGLLPFDQIISYELPINIRLLPLSELILQPITRQRFTLTSQHSLITPVTPLRKIMTKKKRKMSV